MTTYERLEQAAFDNDIHLLIASLPVNGFYYATTDFHTITLSNALQTTCERCCVLAEELGHYHTTPINLFTAPTQLQERYERKAIKWAAHKLVPLPKLVKAWQRGIRSAWELAEYLDVTESFLCKTLELYEAQHGRCVCCGNYCIRFKPVEVYEMDNEPESKILPFPELKKSDFDVIFKENEDSPRLSFTLGIKNNSNSEEE